MITALVYVVTGVAVTVKVCWVLPAATVTEAGTDAELEELDNVTTVPPLGAAA